MKSLGCYRLVPFTKSSNIDDFIVSIDIKSDRVILSYEVEGDLDELLMRQTLSQWQFTDELWKSTVFEIFLKADGCSEYFEWNFCPSKRYAEYSFKSYRHRSETLPSKELEINDIEYHFASRSLIFHLEFKLPSALRGKEEFSLQVSAILQSTRDGSLQYFAIKHPEHRPDFHNQDCFQYYHRQ